MTAAFCTMRYLDSTYSGTVERRTHQGIVGLALHRRSPGSEMLQLSVDGQTGQMGQTGPDGMEWAIPTRILTSRARGLPAKGIDSAQSRLQYHLALRDPYLPVRQDGVDLPKLQKPRPQRLTSRCRGWLPAQAPALGFSSEPYQLCLCSLCHWHVRFCWREAIK